MPVAIIKRKRERCPGGIFAILREMGGNAMLCQRPFQACAQSIIAHLTKERHARAQCCGGKRAIGSTAAHSLDDRRNRGLPIREQMFPRTNRRRLHVAVDVAYDTKRAAAENGVIVHVTGYGTWLGRM